MLWLNRSRFGQLPKSTHPGRFGDNAKLQFSAPGPVAILSLNWLLNSITFKLTLLSVRAAPASVLVLVSGFSPGLPINGTVPCAPNPTMPVASWFSCGVLNPRPEVAEVLDLLKLKDLCNAPGLTHKGLPDPITALGDAAIIFGSGAAEGFRFTGQLFFSLVYAVTHPWRVRWGDVIFSMRRVGVDAVPIVGLISFLLGFIIAFMSSVQLSQFGANVYVAILVAVGMVRELGPIMTAIVVAGRSGSAFASEIGAMKVSEEVDALTVMGFDPVLFLVVPKLMASVAVVPLLTLFANIFGVFGGLVVGMFFLDLTFANYMQKTFEALTLADLIWTFCKGGLFAALIAWVSSLRGFQVKGGAVSVGDAATRAVVGSIFLIIFWDSILAFIQLYYE